MKQVLAFVLFFLYASCIFSYDYDYGKKKYEIEVSIGLSFFPQNSSLYLRSTGLDDIIDHYARYYQAAHTASGESGYIKILFPIGFSFNYSLSERLYVKVGLEYYGSRSSSDKQYQVNWNDAVENYDYKFVYKISGFMPYVGIETRFSSFGLYANVGLSFSSFSYTEKLDFSENSYSHKLDNEFNTDGKGIGIILGGKYMMKIGEKIKLLFKLEYMLLKVSTLKGEKLSNGSSTGGESFSESITGTAYENEINPYDLGWINFWELYETSLDESWVRNFKKLSLNLSSIRFIIGISF